jgi:hypothetical protein
MPHSLSERTNWIKCLRISGTGVNTPCSECPLSPSWLRSRQVNWSASTEVVGFTAFWRWALSAGPVSSRANGKPPAPPVACLGGPWRPRANGLKARARPIAARDGSEEFGFARFGSEAVMVCGQRMPVSLLQRALTMR